MADNLDEISHFVGGNVEFPLSRGVKEEGGELNTIDVGIPETFNDTINYIQRCLASFPDDTNLREPALQKETRAALESINSKYARTRFSLAHILPLVANDIRVFGQKHPYDSGGFRTNYSKQLNTSTNIHAALVCELADYLAKSNTKINSDTFLAQLISILLDQDCGREKVKNILARRFEE